MSSLRGASLKLAIFTIVTAFVTGWLAMIIGNLQLFSEPYDITADFSDATGLLEGDVVKAAGVTVGRVDHIEIEGGLARVTLSIEEDVEIPANVHAHVRFRNLVGQRMVTLTQEGPADHVLEPGARIPLNRTEAAFDLTALFNGLRPLIRSTSATDINVVSRELAVALEGREDTVGNLLTHMTDVSDMIVSSERDLTSLLTNVNHLATDLNGQSEELSGSLGQFRRFLVEIDASKDELVEAIGSLDDAAGRLETLIATNDENIEAEIGDLRILLDAIDDRKRELHSAIAGMPDLLEAVERVNSYGQWSMIHVITVCKDDLGTCGRRWNP